MAQGSKNGICNHCESFSFQLNFRNFISKLYTFRDLTFKIFSCRFLSFRVAVHLKSWVPDNKVCKQCRSFCFGIFNIWIFRFGVLNFKVFSFGVPALKSAVLEAPILESSIFQSCVLVLSFVLVFQSLSIKE